MEPNKDFFQIGYTIAICVMTLASLLFLIFQAKKNNKHFFRDLRTKIYNNTVKTFLEMVNHSISTRVFVGILALYTLLISFQQAVLRFDNYMVIGLVIILTLAIVFLIIAILISVLVNLANFFVDYIYNSRLNNRLTFSV
ncbi:hypothetical protein ABEV55_17895 [Aneurinibacillus thermoaerophilus]